MAFAQPDPKKIAYRAAQARRQAEIERAYDEHMTAQDRIREKMEKAEANKLGIILTPRVAS